MATWAELRAGAPGIAAVGEQILGRTGEALLATVRGEDPPRIHPISVAIVEGRLYAFLLDSAKRRDLERDGRFALHTYVDPAAPSELSLRGRARVVEDADVRSTVAAGWAFTVDDTYRLFEFSIDRALLGERDGPDEWPPRYTSWPATD